MVIITFVPSSDNNSETSFLLLIAIQRYVIIANIQTFVKIVQGKWLTRLLVSHYSLIVVGRLLTSMYTCPAEFCVLHAAIFNETSCRYKERNFTNTYVYIKLLPEPIVLTISITLFILTLINVHKNSHILSETRKRAELSIIYQNSPLVILFLLKYVGSFVIYMIHKENDYDSENLRRIICSELDSVESIFPITYTIANIQKFRDMISCCKRSHRISDRSMQFVSTTHNQIAALTT
ncbi:unnamed protein product [Caenorhabditis angaria]|uniref:G-protein coupled receptors family 1 profile domain-containing protein n=1 Tax=Caenorhabditis angaria TaxID=860376 RepID=A0A9P1J039_9PELO|nr:unnamed protein product [Caenorhabditis angaria]